MVLVGRAGRYAAEGRDDLAEKDLAEARRVLIELSQGKERDNRTVPGEIGRAEVALGRIKLRQGRADEARMLLVEGVGRLESASRSRPASARDRKSLDEAREVLRVQK